MRDPGEGGNRQVTRVGLVREVPQPVDEAGGGSNRPPPRLGSTANRRRTRRRPDGATYDRPVTLRRIGRRLRRLEPSLCMRFTVATSRAGERLGWDWLVYNPLVFLYYHEHARASAPVIADTFEKVFPHAESFVDVGAGTGAFAVELRRRGHEVSAFERSGLARFVGRKQGLEMHNLDFHRPYEVRLPGYAQQPYEVRPPMADIAYCFEVAEHLPPDLADSLVLCPFTTRSSCGIYCRPPGTGRQRSPQ